MAEYHIPRELQVSLREYFRHCRALSRQRYYHDLLVQMSPSLRGQVAVFCHSAWILKVPFFNSPSVSDEEREQFIIQIAMAIEPEAYPPNEPIFRVNNPAMQMYILQKGVVAKQGRVLRGGAYFGEDMILKNYKRPYSVRTLTYVDCFRLDKEKLLDIIRHDEFPATRIAIRRATIALAFRVKFMLMAKAVGCVLGVGLHVVSLATHTYTRVRACLFVVCVCCLKQRILERCLHRWQDAAPSSHTVCRQLSSSYGAWEHSRDHYTPQSLGSCQRRCRCRCRRRKHKRRRGVEAAPQPGCGCRGWRCKVGATSSSGRLGHVVGCWCGRHAAAA